MPIIAMTGHTDEEMVEETYRVGCTDYMQKPMDKARLIELLEMYTK